MGVISTAGYNAIIYMSYAMLLVTGLLLAWRFATKDNFLSSNGTQGGLALAVNFVASGMLLYFQRYRILYLVVQRASGCGPLFT